MSNKELWRARTLCDAVLHPDTQVCTHTVEPTRTAVPAMFRVSEHHNHNPETQMPVPAMFRVCAFGPANIPICAGMLMMV